MFAPGICSTILRIFFCGRFNIGRGHFKSLCLQGHQDEGGREVCFKMLVEARNILMDPEARKVHNKKMCCAIKWTLELEVCLFDKKLFMCSINIANPIITCYKGKKVSWGAN